MPVNSLSLVMPEDVETGAVLKLYAITEPFLKAEEEKS